MTVVAGWYSDPWGEADLRWWDGEAWTGSVHVTAIDLVGAQQPSSQPLARLLAAQGRVAVVDVETTGLYSTDRVVEVAVVTVNRDGAIEEEFETLVNPLRDGVAGMHGYPRVVESSRRSHDVSVQQWLWTVSEDLTGVVYPVS